MISLLISAALCGRFAFLVAGSSGFYNYRHQADIHTLYMKLIDRGYDPKHIIQMACDNIADHLLNPFKGHVFHETDHKIDVYPGSDKIDYKDKDVNSYTFMNILTTKLKSTTSDDLFIYFDDHGDYGMLCFPETDLYADDLKKTMKKMEETGKFGRCFFGIEACYAGSVGKAINTNNTVILTAANDNESSYAAVYDKEMDTYLSNEFTNIWLDLMDQDPKSSIGDFYDKLKEQTEGSHACYFGDGKMRELSIEVFFGAPKKAIDYKPMKRASRVSQAAATYSTLLRMTKSSDASVRARARLTIHEIETLNKKMDFVIDSLVIMLESGNKGIYKQPPGGVTAEYLTVVRHFTSKFGKMNHDGDSKLLVLSNLISKHGSDSVIAAINKIL